MRTEEGRRQAGRRWRNADTQNLTPRCLGRGFQGKKPEPPGTQCLSAAFSLALLQSVPIQPPGQNIRSCAMASQSAPRVSVQEGEAFRKELM